MASFSLYLLRIYHFSTGIKGKKLKQESSTQPLTKPEFEELRKLRNKISANFPPVAEIARIAAILTNGHPANYSQPMVMANQAIELWFACERTRSGKIEQSAQKSYFSEKALSELVKPYSIEITPPKKYPVDFDEFLRLTVGGRHKAHRLKIYRDYAKDMVWLGHVFNLQYGNGRTAVMTASEAEKLAAPASLDEVENYIKGSRGLIEHEGLYFQRARTFLEWRAKQAAERAKKAAAKRWGKK